MGKLKTFLIVIFVVVLCNDALAAESLVKVIGGKELLLYPKKGTSLSSFSASVSQLYIPFGGDSSAKLIGPRVAVAATTFGASTSGIKVADKSSLLTACSRLESAKIGCEINYAVSTIAVPNDSSYLSLPGLKKIGAESAWDTSTGSKSVKVAVIDTGVDYNHPDLSGNISVNLGEVPGNSIDDDGNGKVDDYYGYDIVNSDSNPMDDQSHGTHVAGTIGALGNNSNGVVGVNWAVGIVPVKVLDASGSGSLAGVIAGVDYAVSRGVHVINLSLGGGGYSQASFDSFQRANAAGVLVVAAAGNENNNNDISPSYPASYNLPNIISVAATNTTVDTRASFSNYGVGSVHLAAPGSSILSTLPNGTYGSYSGTSMACPHVAGAAALVKAANSALSMLQIKDLLLNNVDRVDALVSVVATGGRLNVFSAVSAAGGTTPAPQPTAVPTAAPTPDDGGDDGGDDGDIPPGDGDDGGDDPDAPITLAALSFETTITGKNKANIVGFAEDLDGYLMPGVTVTLNCVEKKKQKKVGLAVTNDEGEVTFNYKIKGTSTKCSAAGVDEYGNTASRSFKLKVKTGRKK